MSNDGSKLSTPFPWSRNTLPFPALPISATDYGHLPADVLRAHSSAICTGGRTDLRGNYTPDDGGKCTLGIWQTYRNGIKTRFAVNTR